jgi:hypothetical protein
VAKRGEWIHIRLEYHVVGDSEVRIYAYINGVCGGYSENFYGKYNSSGGIITSAKPKTETNRLQIYSMMSSNGEFYLDNLKADFYSEKD